MRVTARRLLRIVVLMGLVAGLAGRPEVTSRDLQEEGYYRIETIPLPDGMVPEISGLAFTPEGRLGLLNRHGDLWIGDPDSGRWQLFAEGLHEPLGLLWESESVCYVMQRPELTRIRDTNGDGRADSYETVSGEWGITDNYHEFAYGLKRDAKGNFYGGLGLDSGGEELLEGIERSRGPLITEPLLDERQRSVTLFRGWTFRITPEGEFVPTASGFRQPAGIGLSPEGEFFVTDNQGDWVASSGILHVREGRFYGHPGSLRWKPTVDLEELSPDSLYRMRTPPTVVLPHGRLGGSPGEPVWDLTGGDFGPFDGQLFVGDFWSLLSRIHLERVAGEWQGAAFPFLREGDLRQGNMRMAFSPDGKLYIGQTTRGWGEGEGLQRVVWSGEIPVEIQTMELTDSGFDLTFTVPMDPVRLGDPESYRLSRFRYLYHGEYGSPPVDEAPVEILEVRPRPNARGVHLGTAGPVPGFIYELLTPGLKDSEGRSVANPVAYYTLNRLKSGRTGLFGTSRPPLEEIGEPADVEAGTPAEPPDLERGEQLYRMYCLACHQEDGRGAPTLEASDFRRADSPLRSSDADLFTIVRRGREERGMPPFANILRRQEIVDVIHFVRTRFGDAVPER